MERFIVTMCGVEDPVPVTLYPIDNPNDITYGSFSHTQLKQEGIEVIEYETFEAETWKVGSLIDFRIHPHYIRELSSEEVEEIRRKIKEAFPENGDDILY